MSVCTFIASDHPLQEVVPLQDHPIDININIDNSLIYDGDADDNFFLNIFDDVGIYTDKKYGVFLEWNYTDGKAKRIIEYIKDALKRDERIEFWRVWLMDYYEYEDRPVIHKQRISMEELTANHIKEIDSAEVWNVADKMFPNRPSFYCLEISR